MLVVVLLVDGQQGGIVGLTIGAVRIIRAGTDAAIQREIRGQLRGGLAKTTSDKDTPLSRDRSPHTGRATGTTSEQNITTASVTDAPSNGK